MIRDVDLVVHLPFFSVPFNEPRLLGGSDNAASSPWVIAIEKAG